MCACARAQKNRPIVRIRRGERDNMAPLTLDLISSPCGLREFVWINLRSVQLRAWEGGHVLRNTVDEEAEAKERSDC